MPVKISFRLKLVLSYFFVIAVSFLFVFYFLDKNLAESILIRKTILMGLLFALGLAFMLGSVLAAQAVGPINRMIRVSRRFASGDFSKRILGYSGDETGELAVTLNKMAQDIEDKIRQIQGQNQQLSAVFNSMVEGVIVTDISGRIVSVNPAVEDIFAIHKKDAENRFFLEAIRNNDIFDIVDSVLKKGESVSGELKLSWPVQKVFQVNAVPVFEKNRVNGCLTVIHDITGLKKLETIRRDFVANVSHELKTPLTSIMGFVETLLEGALEDKEHNRQFLTIIQEHTRRLNSLVNDLLDLSSLESKATMMEKTEFDLKGLLDRVLSGFTTQIMKKSLCLENALPAGLRVRADKARMEQVLTNLIDNAVKFNKNRGMVKIYCGEEDGGIKITVEDSGTGIPKKDISRIFERFYRVDKARSRELGGTGLGLSIVKHIIELHGGRAGVESSEGLGSRFWFILPR
ncbi:MAG: ATP-binding protein [Candidatus Omnitrophica bacterium]|nr:ATP-binding protein [Candidatus Omnitrophota bacterium]